MKTPFTSQTGITLLGGGEVLPGQLSRALMQAPDLVAVDGGADLALAAGYEPHLVLGDFDSISDQARIRLEGRLRSTPDQDLTDFDKAVLAVRAPLVLALGFTGGRLDHTLASLSTLLRCPQARVVLDAGVDLCFLAPPRLTLDLPVGTRLSLFPMAPVRCATEGLRWSTEGLLFTPGGRLGTSNATARPQVTLRPAAASLLVMVPAGHLLPVLAGLRQAPHWAG